MSRVPRTTSAGPGTSTFRGRGYTSYTTPYLGLHQIIRPDGLYESQQRFGMYRWHVPDPIRFASGLRPGAGLAKRPSLPAPARLRCLDGVVLSRRAEQRSTRDLAAGHRTGARA
jgi:hypothetical protein